MPALSRTPIVALALMLAGAAQASSWTKCEYDAEVQSVSATHTRITHRGVIEESHADGCSRAREMTELELDEIAQGERLLQAGARVRLRWEYYSAPTPEGTMTRTHWRVLPPR